MSNVLFAPRIHDDNVGGIVKVTYDFDVHGGAVGDIPLDFELPANAVIVNGFVDEVEDLTSDGSATIAIKAESAADLKAATAIASYTGRVALIPVGTAATSVKTTEARVLTLTVAVAALTAGKMNIFLDYRISD